MKKPKYYYNQSGVLPFKKNEKGIKVLVISTRKKKKWIFPKGIINGKLSSIKSAEKEAFEEAGVKGKVYNIKLGKYEYNKWGGKCKVKMYPMKVKKELDEYPENFRERKWIDYKKAKKLFDNNTFDTIFENFEKFIND